MKKVKITAAKDDSNQIDIAMSKLQEVQTICSNLEDYYFGEDVVVYFTRRYEFCDTALNQLNKANSKI